MVEKGDTKAFLRKMMPRVFKAAVLVGIVYLPVYFVSALIRPLQSFFPWYEPLANIFAVIFTIFLVVGVFSSGTVFQYVFGVARTLVLMMFFICALNGGVVTLAVPTEGATTNILVDLRIVLAMLVLVCLLGIGKNVIQAIEFMSSKTETKEI